MLKNTFKINGLLVKYLKFHFIYPIKFNNNSMIETKILQVHTVLSDSSRFMEYAYMSKQLVKHLEKHI